MTALAALVSKEEPIWDLFFPRHRLEIMKEMDPFLTKDTAGIVVSYLLSKENPFGAPEWKKYFGVEIADPPKLHRGFYTWWFGRDPLDPTKQRCETHLPPVLRPKGMSLIKLAELVKKPLEGNRTQLNIRIRTVIEIEKIEAGPACFIVLRRGLLERNQYYKAQVAAIKTLNARTGVGYEPESSVIDLATAVFARYACTGQQWLPALNFSRAKEKPSDDVVCLGYLRALMGADEGLNLGHSCNGRGGDHIGITCVRRF